MSANSTPRGKLAPRPEDDDIDSRDLPCTCEVGSRTNPQHVITTSHANCQRHGIAASNARENRYWQRVGRG